VGKAPATRALFAQLERATKTEVPVLLQGEPGTGKELAAQAIHEQSSRAQQPMIVVDCGSIPHALIESELFGREQPGAFERAGGGTIFIDEIGDVPLELQPKLLRVLERSEVQRIGGLQPLPVDARVIAATTRNLNFEVNAGRFRSDLFLRLAVLEIRMPPLRDRLEDLPLLVDRFIEHMGIEDRPEAQPLREPTFRAALARYAWRGNIRELRNFLERALVEPTRPVVAGAGWEAPPEIDIHQRLAPVRDAWMRYIERRYIVELLESHRGNVSAAARAAGIDRAYFYRIMAACGLR
jgi:two-component system, NtrC family, response regulator GlrR